MLACILYATKVSICLAVVKTKANRTKKHAVDECVIAFASQSCFPCRLRPVLAEVDVLPIRVGDLKFALKDHFRVTDTCVLLSYRFSSPRDLSRREQRTIVTSRIELFRGIQCECEAEIYILGCAAKEPARGSRCWSLFLSQLQWQGGPSSGSCSV